MMFPRTDNRDAIVLFTSIRPDAAALMRHEGKMSLSPTPTTDIADIHSRKGACDG
jgi:hypothetical protein